MRRSWRAAAPVVLALIAAVAMISGPWGSDTDRMRSVSTAPGIPGDAHRGERLFRKLDCIRCHSEPRTAGGINVPPSLAVAGSRASATWMAEYLLDPSPLRYRAEGALPDLRMPRPAISRADAIDLAAFLAGQIDTVLIPRLPKSIAGADRDSLAAEGAILFEQYQCRGCHELGGSGRRIGPALDGVGRRRRPEYLRALLLDPKGIIPRTSMKDFDLWEEEADALVAFLRDRSLQEKRIQDPIH